MNDASRRPLKTRSSRWARALAAWLAHHRCSPNFISMLSVAFAIAGAAALIAVTFTTTPWHRTCLLVGAAACIQLRLLCNMIDGMVAVEGGLSSATGDLYNEIPDRFADILFIISTGYAAAIGPWPYAVELGWLAGCLAVLTAYVRALGASVGAGHSFLGPMAKPHRMFTLTLAYLAAAGLAGANSAYWPHVLWVTLALLNVGMLITLWRRTSAIATTMHATADASQDHAQQKEATR